MKKLIFYSILILFFFQSCSKLLQTYKTEVKNEIIEYDLYNSDTLVDVGCGNGIFDCEISHYYPNLYFILEDIPRNYVYKNIASTLKSTFNQNSICPNMINKNSFISGKIDSIPLQSNTYSKVLSRVSLHEFENKDKMADELYRILKPNGILIIVEKEPKFEAEFDKSCLNKYLTKNEIERYFPKMTIHKQCYIEYKSNNNINRINILQFKK